MAIHEVKIFNGFERFWRWTQAALIFILLFSGTGVHGFHHLLDFEQLVWTHVIAAIGLMVLWVFAIFWHLTTGNWRHYMPTTNGLFRVARYYAWDIFKGEDHPYRKHFWRKHNPLQAISYLGLKVFLFPLLWLSGLAHLSYGLWQNGPPDQQHPGMGGLGAYRCSLRDGGFHHHPHLPADHRPPLHRSPETHDHRLRRGGPGSGGRGLSAQGRALADQVSQDVSLSSTSVTLAKRVLL